MRRNGITNFASPNVSALGKSKLVALENNNNNNDHIREISFIHPAKHYIKAHFDSF